MMKEPTAEQLQIEQLQWENRSLLHDNLGSGDPEITRKVMLDLGMTEEEAEAAAQLVVEDNRWKANMRIQTSQTPLAGKPLDSSIRVAR